MTIHPRRNRIASVEMNDFRGWGSEHYGFGWYHYFGADGLMWTVVREGDCCEVTP